MNKEIFEKIATELIFEIGIPDFLNKNHLLKLVDILRENKFTEEQITNLISNLIINEIEDRKIQLLENNKISDKKSTSDIKKFNKQEKEGKILPDDKMPELKSNEYIDYVNPDEAEIYKKQGINLYKGSGKNLKIIKQKDNNQKINNKSKELNKQKDDNINNNSKESSDNKNEKISQYTSDGKYIVSKNDIKKIEEIISDLDLQINKEISSDNALVLTKIKTEISNFLKDFIKLSKEHDINHAREMINKYKLSVNKITNIGEPNKLYFKMFGDKYRKIISGNSGNLLSSVITRVLLDSGINESELLGSTDKISNIIAKKEMTPSKLFTETTEYEIKIKNNTINIGPYKIYKPKQYDYENLFNRFIENGDTKEQAENRIKIIKRAIEKQQTLYSKFLEFAKNPNNNKIKILNICNDCNPTTPEGIKKINNIILNNIIKKLENAFGQNDSNLNKIKTIISEIKNENNSHKIIEYLFKLGHEFTNNPYTKSHSADLFEIIEYLKVTNNGYIAIFPAESNFPLADIIAINSKQPTIKDILENKDNIEAIFVSVDYVSVKKNEGGASATRGKIELSTFKTSGVKEDLLKIINIYDELMNKGEYKNGIELINYLLNKYKTKFLDVYFENYENDVKKYVNNWVEKKGLKKDGGQLHDKKAWKIYGELMFILEAIYNLDVNTQLFKNSTYKIYNDKVENRVSDGINIIAKLKAELDLISNTGKANTQFPTRLLVK